MFIILWLTDFFLGSCCALTTLNTVSVRRLYKVSIIGKAETEKWKICMYFDFMIELTQKIYHTVETFPKSNRKIEENGKIENLTQIYDRSLF